MLAVAVGGLALLGAGVGIGVAVSGSSGGAQAKAWPSPVESASATPLTPAQRCTRVVDSVLDQAVTALQAGQLPGNLSQVITNFGLESPEYRVAWAAQGELQTESLASGDPAGHAARLEQDYAAQECAHVIATNQVDLPSELPPSSAPVPTAPSGFPWVEPLSVTQLQGLGITWSRASSMSVCEAGGVDAATLTTMAGESDTQFQAQVTGYRTNPKATLQAYERAYLQSLDSQGVNDAANLVVAHVPNLCNTLQNSDPGQ